MAYWELRRDDGVVLSAPGGARALAAVRDGEILVYLTGADDEGRLRIGLANGRYQATWFDPKNGTTRRTDDVQPTQGAVELACPTFEEDLVLRIRRK